MTKVGEFKRIYPNSGRIFLDGGLNNKFERSIINDAESPSCLNVNFSNGAVATREGTTKKNPIAMGSFAIDGLYTRHSSEGNQTMMAWAGSNMHAFGTTTFVTVASSESIFTAGQRIAAAEMQDHMFIGNGGINSYKYDGTDFTRHGISAPSAAPSIISGTTAGGTLTGDYRYVVTYVNSLSAEGDVSPVAGTLAVAGGTVYLTSVPTAPQSFGVASRRIYRTVTSGATYLRVATLSDNTTTVYSDNSDDSELGIEAPDDQGEPPKFSAIVYQSNRLFMNDPTNVNYLYYSDLNEPYTVPSTNFLRIGDASGAIIKSLSVYDNSIIVGCENDEIWLVYMPDTTPSNWQVIKVNTTFGNKSPFANIDYQSKQMFPAMSKGNFVGFAALEGAAVSPSATLTTVSALGSLLQSDRLEPDMFNVQTAQVSKMSGIVYKNRGFFAVTYGAGNTTNNRIYMVDFSISNLTKKNELAWVPWTGDTICPSQFTEYDGDLYFGSTLANGFVYQLEDSSYTDDGSAIDSYYWTKELSGDQADVNFTKDFRYINMLVEMLGAYNMDLVYRVDSDSGDGTTTAISLDPGGSLWGVMVWGTDIWGGGNAQDDKTVSLGQLTGKRIQFKFTNQNTAGQGFKVHWMNFTYNIKGLR